MQREICLVAERFAATLASVWRVLCGTVLKHPMVPVACVRLEPHVPSDAITLRKAPTLIEVQPHFLFLQLCVFNATICIDAPCKWSLFIPRQRDTSEKKEMQSQTAADDDHDAFSELRGIATVSYDIAFGTNALVKNVLAHIILLCAYIRAHKRTCGTDTIHELCRAFRAYVRSYTSKGVDDDVVNHLRLVYHTIEDAIGTHRVFDDRTDAAFISMFILFCKYRSRDPNVCGGESHPRDRAKYYTFVNAYIENMRKADREKPYGIALRDMFIDMFHEYARIHLDRLIITDSYAAYVVATILGERDETMKEKARILSVCMISPERGLEESKSVLYLSPTAIGGPDYSWCDNAASDTSISSCIPRLVVPPLLLKSGGGVTPPSMIDCVGLLQGIEVLPGGGKRLDVAQVAPGVRESASVIQQIQRAWYTANPTDHLSIHRSVHNSKLVLEEEEEEAEKEEEKEEKEKLLPAKKTATTTTKKKKKEKQKAAAVLLCA